MGISINPRWNGNVPEHEFENIEDAVKYIQSNPSYEYLMNKRVRPYGDIDHYIPDTMDKEEYEILNIAVWYSLVDYFKSVNRKVSLYTSSSYEAKKISWRWVIPDVYVDSYKHAKEFAKVIYSQIEFPAGYDIKPDYLVYASNKKMRMVGTSKPGENRPLVCDNCELVDTIITYIPENAEYIPIELAKEPVRERVVCELNDKTIIQALDCISVQSWKSYEICRNLIWAMCSCNVQPDTIHFYASKASNYEHTWVENLIKSHNPLVSPTISYIRKHAKLNNPEQYAKIQFPAVPISPETIKQNINELLTLTTNENTIYDKGRYMMEIPDDPTIAMKGAMGLGKTTAVKQYILKNLDKRILVLSPRRTFSDSIYGDIEKYGFVHYEHHKAYHKKQKAKIIPQITADKVILQVSGSLKLIKDQSFDIIICDEIESILAMLSPNTIYKKPEEYVTMYTTFERIMRDSKKVLCFDAFLTDRTMNMLHALRGSSKLIINSTLPYNRKCTEITDENVFYATLKKRIVRDKKRIVSIWGTVDPGKEFHTMLEAEGIKTTFYHRKSNETTKTEHMRDVNKHWAEYQSIGYTSTLTVGVNYTNEKAVFDQLSLYASAWGATARDYVQSLHRARNIADDELLVHISKRVNNKSIEAGFTNQVDMWDKQLELTAQTLEALGERPTNYKTLPEWLKHVILWNRNERATNHRHFPELMKKYLELCGIEIEETRQDGNNKNIPIEKTYVQIEDVRIISHEEADHLIANRKMLDQDDIYALERHFLSNYVHTIDQFIWEQWLKNKSAVEHAYMIVHYDPATLLQKNDVKILELVPKDVGRLKFMQSLLFDWTKSWKLPIEEIPKLDLSPFSLRSRSNKDTHDQYCRDLAKSIENWCGFAISVKQKQVRKNGVKSYEYTMVYNYEESTAKYIEPKFTFEE